MVTVFVNAGRVGKERLKIKKGGLVGSGDEFISAFAKFTKEYPGFVIFSQLGAVTVICVQSPLMRTEMVKERLLDGPVNGLVNDAAHGWWKEWTSLLVMSSSYCPDLLCWVPGVISYANGASGEHFKCHFMAVLESIAHEAGLKGHPIVDKLFTGVMDFSEAERLGFTMAFIEFWTIRSDSRSTKELSEAAGRLLRGCQEHFWAAVTRVAHINGAVPPDLKDAFTQRALGLLGCSTTDEFQHRAALIVRDFPKLKSWMEWWMRPAHASMLFQLERKMEIEIWDSIPKTTNAQESMHWKFYSMCGRDHSFLEGMYALWAVATYYQHLLNAVSKGTPIRYGAPEPWKVKAAAIGRTKPSRAPRPEEKKRKKNDGHPPDSVKELLLAPTTKLTVPKPPKPMIKELLTAPKLQVTAPKLLTAPIKPAPAPPGFQFGPASYPWKDNSCWLDASLEVLYVAIERDFPEFCDTFRSLDPDSKLEPRGVSLGVWDEQRWNGGLFFRLLIVPPALSSYLPHHRCTSRTVVVHLASSLYVPSMWSSVCPASRIVDIILTRLFGGLWSAALLSTTAMGVPHLTPCTGEFPGMSIHALCRMQGVGIHRVGLASWSVASSLGRRNVVIALRTVMSRCHGIAGSNGCGLNHEHSHELNARPSNTAPLLSIGMWAARFPWTKDLGRERLGGTGERLGETHEVGGPRKCAIQPNEVPKSLPHGPSTTHTTLDDA
ncbi:hypothetical protein M413DRAFT_32045 [Hebeloma cylindrosporum]|uniref:Uncharacterized protein n=1 Tax=Hebeloma cylindrosporum TaxID=76867 RepID=A0A0C2XDI9_HEBCY|nr:hypothetical protein M413DRAFT_32045 [Hebeloma cylindrosporum h7]